MIEVLRHALFCYLIIGEVLVLLILNYAVHFKKQDDLKRFALSTACLGTILFLFIYPFFIVCGVRKARGL